MSKNLKILTLSLLSIFLLITSYLTVRVVTTPKPEEVRTWSRAEVTEFNDVLVEFDAPSTLYVGQEYALPLTINTQGTEVVSVQLQITFNENGPFITPINDSLEASLTRDFNYPFNQIITDPATGMGTIQIAATVPSQYPHVPFVSTSPITFAVFHFRVENSGNTSLNFDDQISAVYPLGSTKDVLLSEDTTLNLAFDNNPPAAFNLSAPSDNSQVGTQRPTFSWHSSSDAETGLAKYKLFLDGSLAIDNIPPHQTSQQAATPLVNGTSHTWYVKAIDKAGNERQSTNTWTVTINTQNSLSFQIKFQGIDSPPSDLTKEVRVTLRPATGGADKVRENIQVTYDAHGVYTGTVDNIISGRYTVLIKGPAHLQKNFGEVEFIAGQTIEKDWTSEDQVLLAGDITGPGEGVPPPDNKVEGADYGLFASLFNPFETVPPDTLADFDSSGKVDGGDYGLFASNFNPFGGGDE